MKKIIVLFIVILFSLFTYSQEGAGYLNITGNIYNKFGNSLDAVLLVTDTGNTFIKTINCPEGKFNVNLPFGFTFIITFIEENYLSKSIVIVTNSRNLNNYFFKFNVLMENSGIKFPVVVGSIYYDQLINNYNFKIIQHNNEH